jgi:tetratricopeptide (TPR) repeat protein
LVLVGVAALTLVVVAVCYFVTRPQEVAPSNTPVAQEETITEAVERIGLSTNGLIDEQNANAIVTEIDDLLSRTETGDEKSELYQLQGKTYSNAGLYDQAAAAYQQALAVSTSDDHYVIYRSLFNTYEQLGDQELQKKYLELLLAEPYEGYPSREMGREYYMGKLNELEQGL